MAGKIEPRKWVPWAVLAVVVLAPLVLMSWIQAQMEAASDPIVWLRANMSIMGLWALSALLAGGAVLAGAVLGIVRLVKWMLPDKREGRLATSVRGGAMSVALLPGLLAIAIGTTEAPTAEMAQACNKVAAPSPLLAANVLPFALPFPQDDGDGDCDLEKLEARCTGCDITSIPGGWLSCILCLWSILDCGGDPEGGCDESWETWPGCLLMN